MVVQVNTFFNSFYLHYYLIGAVYSLLGFNFIYAIKDSYLFSIELIKKRISERRDNKQFDNKIIKDKKSLKLLLKNVINIVTICNIIMNERASLILQSGRVDSIFDIFISTSKIVHSAHIQGFLFGSSIAAILIWKRARAISV